MKIIIPGGTGQIGTMLARTMHREGHDVVVLGRHPDRSATPWRSMVWDPASEGRWVEEIDGSDVVINLAGRSVNCRYTPGHREEIMQSRIISVCAVGKAISRAKRPPAVWLQASTATIYADRYDAGNDESTGIIGGNEPGVPDSWHFSIDVATAWERALDEATTPLTRKVKLRAAMVMTPDRGGIFDTLSGLVRRGLGGTAGHGRQFVSWIHGADFARAIMWLVERKDIDGVINIASPSPLPNREFMAILRKAHGMPIGLPATAWMLELGAMVLRTETELILKSRRVIPGRLIDEGFTFDYPTWQDAATELCKARKSGAA